ncbi:MAG: phosphatidylserine/phosphatidylglycerophosphate/cardiolipin synthase family protein [Bacteroidetes bacterium]|nr:phosphatidylserine/phosphatidylglycerophosphate/cardiolipin synthase family protein [Bacteroidota bacterium]
MPKTLLSILILILLSASVKGQKIKVYFTQPVDTTISSGVSAQFLYESADDTLIAYIQRAKYSIDIAVFSYYQSSLISNIVNAVNQAYLNGKRVRWIYDGGVGQGSLSNLNAGIRKLASPTSSAYNIMHHKFVVFDADSPDPNDPTVWTGSMNWNDEQMNDDENNIIIINDYELAQAYKGEFNEMWGDTGLIPNQANSRFGAFKIDNTQHVFNIEGKTVECYFSPSDHTNDHILSAINSANSDLMFGVYTFTDSWNADSIVNRINHGVYVTGIMDQYSLPFTAYSTLSPIMGNNLKIYSDPNYIYHTKHMIVDACATGSDPLVETGSHNWTITADSKNDENILIIHDDTIANIYHQAFKHSFERLGGTLTPCTGTSVVSLTPETILLPTSVHDQLILPAELSDFELFDCIGRRLSRIRSSESRVIDFSNLPVGFYIWRSGQYTGKIFKN